MPNLAVVCCGCFRVLGKDGSLLGERHQFGGLVDMPTIIKWFSKVDLDPAKFIGRVDADKEARRNGWEVMDSDGLANHRCPECVRDQPRTGRSQQVGCYLEWPIRREDDGPGT